MQWLAFQTKKIPPVLLEETEEDRLQKICDICQKPVFSFVMRRHMESHARRMAENAARVRGKPWFYHQIKKFPLALENIEGEK